MVCLLFIPIIDRKVANTLYWNIFRQPAACDDYLKITYTSHLTNCAEKMKFSNPLTYKGADDDEWDVLNPDVNEDEDSEDSGISD